MYLGIKNPDYIIINGADDNALYYTDEVSYFKEPTFVQDEEADELFTFHYNDGTTKDIDQDDIDTLEYRLTSNGSALVEDTDTVPASQSYIYVYILLNNGESAVGSYPIHRKADTVASLTVTTSILSFVLGNYLEKYKGNSFKVTARYDNYPLRADEANFTGYTFDYTSLVMSASDLGSSIILKVGTKSFTIPFVSGTDVSYSNPTISSVVITDSTGLKQSYQNDLDRVDLTEFKLQVNYTDAAYYKEVGFDTSANTCDASHYSVTAKNLNTTPATSILTNVNDLNGHTPISLSGSAKIFNCSFYFTVYNEFTTNTSIEVTSPFNVMALTEVLGLRIAEPYTDYKVGEKFLKDEDTTKVTIFFTDTDNGVDFINSTTLELKKDLPMLSLNHAKGEEWTTVDTSKRIVVSSVFSPDISAEYNISVTYDGYVSGKNSQELVVVWQPYIWTPDHHKVEEDNGVLGIYDITDTTVSDGIRSLINPATAVLKGYIRNIFNTKLLDSEAVMVLFDDYAPPARNEPNITVKFPCYTGLAGNINKCNFGILFGNNNANNRLFVSGNPNIPNADWHSAETNVIHTEGEAQKINGDFSYFPAESIMYYGETDNKVIGYDIVSNDKLLVLKDHSDKEKSVYFRTPVMLTALDATGAATTDVQGNTLYQEEFSLVKGNNSVSGISPHAIANLNGDTLFIDYDNTVEGLDLTGIVGDSQRYANSRSQFIDGFLKDKDLDGSFLWTNNKYMFFVIKDEGIFVTHRDAFGSESKQYDWWLLQGENPTTFAEIEGSVYFGNAKGELFKMRNGEYRDEYKVFVNEGQGVFVKINDSSTSEVIDGVTIPGESAVVSESVWNEMFPSDKPYYNDDGEQIRHLFFRSVNTSENYLGSMFYQIGDIVNREQSAYENVSTYDLEIVKIDNVYYLSVEGMVGGEVDADRKLELVNLLKENREYYLNYSSEGGWQEVKCNSSSKFYRNYNNRFRLNYQQHDTKELFLMDIWNNVSGQWENINLGDLYRANLVTKIDGEYEIGDIDEDTYSFKLKDENGKLMNISKYGEQGTSNKFMAEIIERKNVSAYYITAPFTMGSLNYLKTIWQITLTNDTGKPSELELAIASNKVPYVESKDIATVSKAKIGTNFWDFSFNPIDFDKNVTPRTYTIQRTIGRQKFVCFTFKNDNNSNAILSSMSVTYTIPFPSFGSD